MSSAYGVGGLMHSMRMENAMDGYADCVTEMLQNADFRDMYLDTMEAYTTGHTNDMVSPIGDPINEAINDITSECGLNDMECDFSVGTEEGRFCGDECDDFSCHGAQTMFGSDDDSKSLINKRLNDIPGTDPTDAGTFFNLKNSKPSVECQEASQDMINMISNYIPSTEISVAIGNYHDYNQNSVRREEAPEITESATLSNEDVAEMYDIDLDI